MAIKQASGSYIVTKSSDSADNNNIAGTLALTTVGSENSFGDAPQEQGGFKAEYQKTATKMAMSLKETPQAISVVTRDSLDARLVKDIANAVELTAGVSNSANGDGIQTGPGMFGGQGQYDQKFTTRGQPSSMRSDGFKVGNSNIDLAVYERVEVVKGPAGFYGQGSLGGFINMVRKKPQAEFSAKVNVQAGSFDTYRSDVDVTGALNKEETLNAHVSLAYENSGSFVDDIENERMMIAPSIEAIISDNTRVLLQMLYQKDEFDANPGIPLQPVGDQIKLWDSLSSSTKLYGATGDKSETEISELIIKVDHQISDRWLASLQLQGNKSTRNIIEGNATSVYNYGSGYYLYTTATKDGFDRDFWAGELKLEGAFDAFGQEHKILIGAELNDQHHHRKFGSNYTKIGKPNSFTGDFSDYGFSSKEDISTTVDRDTNNKNSAVYAQAVLSLQEKTKLLISGRYDKTSTKDIHYDGRPDSEEFKDGALTMRLGLTHGFNENISAYAIYAESFEPTQALASSENGGGTLEPITGEGYELGLKTDWFNNQLGATVAVYQQDLTNRPLADPDDRTGQYSVSSGLHRTEGIEFEVNGSPFQGLTIAAAALWQDNEFLDDKNNQGLAIDGSVDNQFSFYANYEWHTGALQGVAVGATFINVGERQFIRDKSFLDNNEQMTLEGYNRADIHLSYSALPNWDISLLIRNVTDEAYIESATLLGSGNYRGSPRAALLNVAYHFD
jgi:TonB-dependent siderophore receptor